MDSNEGDFLSQGRSVTFGNGPATPQQPGQVAPPPQIPQAPLGQPGLPPQQPQYAPQQPPAYQPPQAAYPPQQPPAYPPQQPQYAPQPPAYQPPQAAYPPQQPPAYPPQQPQYAPQPPAYQPPPVPPPSYAPPPPTATPSTRAAVIPTGATGPGAATVVPPPVSPYAPPPPEQMMAPKTVQFVSMNDPHAQVFYEDVPAEMQPQKAEQQSPQDNPQQDPAYQQFESPGESGLGKAPQQSAERRPLRIGDRLLELGLISKDQLEIALREQAKSKKLLGQIMIQMNFITESALGEVLAESSGSERFDAKTTILDAALIASVPRDVCIRNKIIPVEQSHGIVKVAMADVYNVLAIDQIRRHLDKSIKIVPVYSTETEINELIERNYNYDLSIDGILREIETGIRDKSQLDGREEGYVNPTVRLVNSLLIDAIRQGCSDIHFEPEGSFLRLRYRIDGSLQQIRSFHRDYWPSMLVRMKIMSGMNIAETRSAQDGRINMVALGREIDFRVATQPTVHGENVVLRILDKSKSLVHIDHLGFSDHNLELLKRCIRRPEGIIVVTGPTGSGKTTTLYSVLSYINSIEVNIMTLEDPVEYQLPLIRQTNVREGTIDFQSGIKSLMRQDPDIIFLGEVRDQETAIMAIRAALTGHQVYTTLHTNDALGTIPRLSDIGVPAHLIAGSLVCAMAQRLSRRLCKYCRKPRYATAEECRILRLDAHKPPIVHDAVGCDKCGFKGYKGRIGIHEILRIDHGLDELIATSATRNRMMEYALQNGFVPMVQDGITKLLAGEIDIPELINTVDLTDRL